MHGLYFTEINFFSFNHFSFLRQFLTALAGLELVALMPLSPQCWDHRFAPSHMAKNQFYSWCSLASPPLFLFLKIGTCYMALAGFRLLNLLPQLLEHYVWCPAEYNFLLFLRLVLTNSHLTIPERRIFLQ